MTTLAEIKRPSLSVDFRTRSGITLILAMHASARMSSMRKGARIVRYDVDAEGNAEGCMSVTLDGVPHEFNGASPKLWSGRLRETRVSSLAIVLTALNAREDLPAIVNRLREMRDDLDMITRSANEALKA